MKRKRNKLIAPLIAIYIMLSGYTFPEEAPYIDVNCSLGNNLKIYIPKDKVQYVKIEGTDIVNISSGLIYGYTENNRIYFPIYNRPYYTTSYTDVDLNVSRINEINLYTSTTDYLRSNALVFIFLILGGIFIWQVLS